MPGKISLFELKTDSRTLDFIKLLKRVVLDSSYASLAPAGIFSGGIDVHQGRACKEGRRVGGSGRRRSFQKISKKSMQNLHFLILKEISRFFQNF